MSSLTLVRSSWNILIHTVHQFHRKFQSCWPAVSQTGCLDRLAGTEMIGPLPRGNPQSWNLVERRSKASASSASAICCYRMYGVLSTYCIKYPGWSLVLYGVQIRYIISYIQCAAEFCTSSCIYSILPHFIELPSDANYLLSHEICSPCMIQHVIALH